MKLVSKHIPDGWEVYIGVMSPNAVEVNWTSCCSSAKYRSWNTSVLKPSGHSPKPLPAHLQKMRSLHLFITVWEDICKNQTTHWCWSTIFSTGMLIESCWNIPKVTQKNMYFDAIWQVFINYPQRAHLWLRVMSTTLSRKFAFSGILFQAS